MVRDTELDMTPSGSELGGGGRRDGKGRRGGCLGCHLWKLPFAHLSLVFPKCPLILLHRRVHPSETLWGKGKKKGVILHLFGDVFCDAAFALHFEPPATMMARVVPKKKKCDAAKILILDDLLGRF